MRILEVVLCLAIAVGAVACDRSQQSTRTDSPAVSAPSPAERAKVTGIQLGTQLSTDGHVAPGAERSTFAPSDTIYVTVLTDHPPAGATISARWTYQDGQLVSEGHESLTSFERTATEFHISKPDGFPPGRYKVEIAMNGESAGEREFEVR